MKRRVIILVLIGLLIINIVPFIERAAASYELTKSSGSTSPPPTIGGASQKASLSPAQKKLSSDLVQRETQVPSSGTFMMMAKTAKTGEDLAYVYVFMIPSASTYVIDPYVSSVTDRDEQNHVAVAWVNVNDLEELASLSEVRQIQTVIPPQVNTGSVTAQSDAILHTAELRSTYGFDGTGIKVGIISDGVDHIATAQASGDLPTTASGKIHVLSNTRGGDEGTAMLEIVHDMAPGAELYFHDYGSNTVAFNSAVDELRAAGCNVICDDVGWLTEPFFEDGIVASHVRDLLASQNFIYVSSAGNAATSHYQGTFYDRGSNWHDFSQGSDATYKSLYLNLPSGSSVIIVLEWNDQFGHSANDYDLYLSQSSFGDLGYSENSQTGTQNPVEFIQYTNTGGSQIVGQIDVYKYSGTAKTLEVYIYGATPYSNNLRLEDSIFGHPAVPDVIAVGAIRASDPGNDDIESFSSRGPVTISYPSAQSRQKPDLAGIDGVSVTGAGGFSNPFYGTSAAAPTVAAVAADIWSGATGKSALEVRNQLYSTAIDLGASGKDTIFGNGRVDALRAVFIGGISISSTPSGANIYLDGVYKGLTPITLAGVTPGSYTVKLNKTNYRDDIFTVNAVAGQTTTVSRTLVPTTVGTVPVEGNVIGPQFSVDISLLPPAWGMAFGDNSWFSPAGTTPLPPVPPGGGLTVTAHATQGVAFSISASDKLDGAKPVATKGKMAEYHTPQPPLLPEWVKSGKVLTKPLRVHDTASHVEYNLTGSDPVLFTGVGDSLPGGGGGTGTSHSFDMRQQITLADVPVVSTPPPPASPTDIHVYKMPITFTLTAL